MAVLFACVTMAATISGAAAHAVLLATVPADGATLTAPPGEIALRFNESVTPISMRVIGPDGRTVAAGSPGRAFDSGIRLPLPPRLTEGGYLVSWRVVSADSHPVGGSFAFAVGVAPDTAIPPTDDAGARDGVWKTAKILLRWIQNVALMLAAGGALFQALVVRAGPPVRGLGPAIVGSATVAIVAAGLGIGVQGGLLAAAPVSALGEYETWRLGAFTSAGTAALVMVPAVALVALATAASSHWPARVVAALGGIAAAASLALTGHSAAAGWIAQAMLAIHSVAVAFWVGALWPLRTIVRTRPPGEAAILVRRFAAIAVPAVMLLAVAGIATAAMRIEDPAALLGSGYGRTLLLKLALVALLLVVAATNRRRLTPALVADPEARAMLARNIGIELALAGAILLGTAVLAHTPPRDQGTTPREPHAHGATDGYTVTSESRGHTLRLEVAPARIGTNALILRLSGTDGRAFDPLELTVALSLPAAGIEPLARVPERTGDGRYALSSLDLPVAGQWHVRVDALVSDFEKVTFTATVPIR